MELRDALLSKGTAEEQPGRTWEDAIKWQGCAGSEHPVVSNAVTQEISLGFAMTPTPGRSFSELKLDH